VSLTLSNLALADCTGAPMPPRSDGRPTTGRPTWALVAEAESERYLTDRCAQHAPPEKIEFDDPEFMECYSHAIDAVERAWQKISSDALRRCVDTGQACCFEKVPSEHELLSAIEIRLRPQLGVTGQTLDERKSACDEQCSRQIGHAPGADATCQPLLVDSPEDRERFRTPAMRAVVAECAADPSAISRCATLRGIYTIRACEFECQRLGSAEKPQK
jgi:hypothetical protein